MLFNSHIFIFFFFPLILIGYYGLRRWKDGLFFKLWLIGLSLCFYAYFNPSYLMILLGSIVVNYIFYCLINKITRNSSNHTGKTSGINIKRIVYILGVLVDVLVLFYFKYFDFFLSNLNSVFKTDYALRGILLPLGISFFTFQQIGFLTDTYKGEIKECTFIDYTLFVSFFPQLIAGPIVNHGEMLPQFKQISTFAFIPERFAKGLYLFVLGLGKKILIADIFGNAVNWGYEFSAYLDSTTCILIALFYTFQIYFDFSGYCDMARGLAHMLMLELPINFDSPYKAGSPVEFWKRWHITLTRFLTKNLYYPLGGNRKGKARQYLNIFLVFLVSGIWHGAGWNFVIWGMLHGVAQIVVRMAKPIAERIRRNKVSGKIMEVAGVAVTFVFVNITWIFFRSESLDQAVSIIRTIFGPTFARISLSALGDLAGFFNVLGLVNPGRKINVTVMALYVLLSAVLIWLVPNAGKLEEKWKPSFRTGIATVFIFLLSLVSMSGVSTFLYFNF